MDVPGPDRLAHGGLPGHLHPHGHRPVLRATRFGLRLFQPAAHAHLGGDAKRGLDRGAPVHLHGGHPGALRPCRRAFGHHGPPVRAHARRPGHIRGGGGRPAGGLHRHRGGHCGDHGPVGRAHHAPAQLPKRAGLRHGGRFGHPGPDHPAVHRAGAFGHHRAGAGGRPVHGRHLSRPDPGGPVRHLHHHHHHDQKRHRPAHSQGRGTGRPEPHPVLSAGGQGPVPAPVS